MIGDELEHREGGSERVVAAAVHLMHRLRALLLLLRAPPAPAVLKPVVLELPAVDANDEVSGPCVDGV